ncbi:MAG TPA: cytochrome c oxidase subunit II [Streptosporangiaceae bacterium]|nr:cytochrome c oxidase subunit II [Streptosporangiaceae bacterium]
MSPTPSAPRRRGTHVPSLRLGIQKEAAPPRRPARGLRRWAPRAALLAVVAMATAGCQSTTFTRLGLPVPVTKQGQVVVNLWQGSWIAALAVGFLVWGLILWAVIFHRKRSDSPPYQVRYNLPIEMLYTVVPFIMVGVFFFFTARDENYIDKLPPHPDVIVNVTGFQWSWQFGYPQYKVPGSATGAVTENGAPWPGRLPVLEIPTNRTVRFNLTSTDVVHSFWIVPFEFKRDVIPGHPNHFEVTPIRTGSFIGRCTELCGLYHSRMLFTVRIVTPAQFHQWISAQQQAQLKSAGGTS